MPAGARTGVRLASSMPTGVALRPQSYGAQVVNDPYRRMQGQITAGQQLGALQGNWPIGSVEQGAGPMQQADWQNWWDARARRGQRF